MNIYQTSVKKETDFLDCFVVHSKIWRTRTINIIANLLLNKIGIGEFNNHVVPYVLHTPYDVNLQMCQLCGGSKKAIWELSQLVTTEVPVM